MEIRQELHYSGRIHKWVKSRLSLVVVLSTDPNQGWNLWLNLLVLFTYELSGFICLTFNIFKSNFTTIILPYFYAQCQPTSISVRRASYDRWSRKNDRLQTRSLEFKPWLGDSGQETWPTLASISYQFLNIAFRGKTFYSYLRSCNRGLAEAPQVSGVLIPSAHPWHTRHIIKIRMGYLSTTCTGPCSCWRIKGIRDVRAEEGVKRKEEGREVGCRPVTMRQD